MSLPFSASKYVLNISSVSNLAFLSTFEPNNSQKRCVFVLFSAFSFFLLSLFSATFYILYAILYLFWPLLTALFSKPISIQALQCQELTTLWAARLDDGAELKMTDPKEQQRDVEEEETESEEQRDGVD